MIVLFDKIMEVRELSKAVRGYIIVFDKPRSSADFKDENFWYNPPKPFISEFELSKIPPLWSKIGIRIVLIEKKEDEEKFYGIK